jgi:hypothetical protein
MNNNQEWENELAKMENALNRTIDLCCRISGKTKEEIMKQINEDKGI